MDLKILKDIPPWDWPEGAGKMLLDVLLDEEADESERLLAVELAGDFTVINGDLVDALLSILQSCDASDEMRGQAALSLGPVLEYTDDAGFEDPDDTPITESMFQRIQKSLHKLYLDAGVPEAVRLRILEASVRAPEDWHRDAVRAAYFSDDEDWKLTAVFSMRWIRGFDDQILEALESPDEEIHYQAVCAAGAWEVDAAWSHVSGLVTSKETDKFLLLAAIEALPCISPKKAPDILFGLTESDDEDIVEAAQEAMIWAGEFLRDEYDDGDEEDGTIH